MNYLKDIFCQDGKFEIASMFHAKNPKLSHGVTQPTQLQKVRGLYSNPYNMSKNEKTRSKVVSPARKVVLQEKKRKIFQRSGVESWRHA